MHKINKPKISLETNDKFKALKKLTKKEKLHTVCEEAKCPNIYECWSKYQTATFMALGAICTRRCRFCSVKTGKPLKVDELEPIKIANSIKKMNLKHAVITMVTRDDLKDGGAKIMAECVKEIKKISDCKVELLTSDFMNNVESLKLVVDSKPEVLSHNLETVERLTPAVRSRFKYENSLLFLKQIKELDPNMITKSSIMVGLGETYDEISKTMDDLLECKVFILNIGQYLQPSKNNLKVEKFYQPQEFLNLKQLALKKGFVSVSANPLVRSSYHSDEQYFEYIKTVTEMNTSKKNNDYEEKRKRIHPLFKGN